MKLPRLAVLSFFFMVTANAQLSQDLAGRDHAHAMLLLGQSDFEVRLGAKSLTRFESNPAGILDLAAEVTWTACSGNRKMDPDTLAWLAKALGKTKQPRFAGLLDSCLSNPTYDKAKKHLKLARDAVGGDAANSFEGGKLDLSQMRTRLTKKGDPTSRNQLAKKFDDLRGDRTTVDEVYSVFGRPDNVSGKNIPSNKVGFMFVKVRTSDDMLILEYGGLGTARFIYDEAKIAWLLDEAKSERDLYWLRRDGRLVTIDELILNADRVQLREMANQLIKQDSVKKDVLDRVAERIYASRLEKDDDMADSLAWLCRVIEKSGDGRYKQLLLDVSETAADRTLRKYAAKAANSLADTTEAKFVPPK